MLNESYLPRIANFKGISRTNYVAEFNSNRYRSAKIAIPCNLAIFKVLLKPSVCLFFPEVEIFKRYTYQSVRFLPTKTTL